MITLGRIANTFSLLKSEPHLIALMMIVAALGVVILAVVAGGAWDPWVFGAIFLVLVITLAVAGVVAIGYISFKPSRGKQRTELRMEEVANRYPAG
ncbi:MAG: hypothetical protein BZY80_05550 [SAR202 cluster bacterium Io17-Chloro-G2]|nr:MAG: hypothetical protein BZY80_05550 [SAR202 cluster bacterium Io17-Chloro-G2]